MSAASMKVIFAALAGNTIIAVIKFVAAALTGSSAMLSEGIHSLVDTGNQVLLLVGIRRSRRPPGPDFPYGHGKEVYFWSFVVAIPIFAVGAGISIYEGIKHLLHPELLQDPTLNYIVLGLAMLFEGIAWSIALKEFSKVKGSMGYFEAVHRGKDPTMFLVLFEDSAAILGLVVAFAGILLSGALLKSRSRHVVALKDAGRQRRRLYLLVGFFLGGILLRQVMTRVVASTADHQHCSEQHDGPIPYKPHVRLHCG